MMSRAMSEKWACCKAALAKALDQEDADSWLRGLQLLDLSAKGAVLGGIPNAFFQRRIQGQFAPLLRQELRTAFPDLDLPENLTVELHLSHPNRVHPRSSVAGGSASGTSTAPGASSGRDGKPASGHNTRNSTHSSSTASNGSTIHGSAARRISDHANNNGNDNNWDSGSDSGSNGRGLPGLGQSLDSFVPGKHNGPALAFCRAIAEHPGQCFNPLYLTGGSGLGKTHLLRGLAAALEQQGMAVMMTSGDRFMVSVIDGIRQKRMPAVRESLREAEGLLVDDLPALANSQRAQEELLRTFDALHETGRPLVFSGTVAPAEVPKLSEALRGRLEMGVQAVLYPPDTEARQAILRGSAARAKLHLSEALLARLADRISGDPRRLEGAIVQLVAHGSMFTPPAPARAHQTPPPPAAADQATAWEDQTQLDAKSLDAKSLDAGSLDQLLSHLYDCDPGQKSPLPPLRVLEAVSAQFGISQRQIKGRERSRMRNLARRMAMLLLRESCGLSYSEIGTLLGNRSHSTVLEGISSLRTEVYARPEIGLRLTTLRRTLNNPGVALNNETTVFRRDNPN